MFSRDELKIANILPPLFINLVIAIIWAIYVGLHLLPLLQIDVPDEYHDLEEAAKGCYHMIISQILVMMLLVCYARAFLTNPGSVPDTPEWKMGFRTHAVLNLPQTFEVKESGDRRHCKWCLKYKPDRCHHCRICKTCVLKMDHHCPWIMNCVGFRNHKYFFLLVIYAVLSCIFIAYTISETVHQASITDTPANNRFFLVLGLLLAILMGTLMGIFLCFHIWLMLNASTTIEFCEKNTRALSATSGKKTASYDAGFYKNWQAVFGTQPLLWFLPLSPPPGDGIDHYDVDSAKAHADPEWTGNTSSN